MEQRDGGSRKEKLGAGEDSVIGPVSSLNTCWRSRRGRGGPCCLASKGGKTLLKDHTESCTGLYIKKKQKQKQKNIPKTAVGTFQNIQGKVKIATRTRGSGQFSHSVCLNLCDPMDHSMPGFPVHHHLPEFAQTCVHRVGDALQTSHLLLSSFPPAFNLSQHQSFPLSQFFASGGLDVN